MASFLDIKTRLNTELGDSDNATFSDTEKNEALTRAFEDEMVAVIERDTSVVITNSLTDYTLLSSIRAIYEIKVDTDGTGNYRKLSAEAYDYIQPILELTYGYATALPSGSRLKITQLRKLGVNDDIPSKYVPYVLNQAIAETVAQLQNKKINRFLRNDTTMAELLQRGQTAERKAGQLKKLLPQRRFVKV